MGKYKLSFYVIIASIGFIIFLVGVFLKYIFPSGEDIIQTASYILIGLGSGIFGANIGLVLKRKAVFNDPKAIKEIEFAKKDERNQTIVFKAKAKVYNLMIYIYSVMLLVFTLLQINIYVIITLLVVYVLFILAYVYYFYKYNSEM